MHYHYLIAYLWEVARAHVTHIFWTSGGYNSFGSLNSSHNSFRGYPELCLMFSYGSVHLCLSVAELRISEDNYARFLTANIIE